jgi:hypothetical protein
MRWSLLALLAATACGSSGRAVDAGSDAGFDAGPPPVTDGGAIGAACESLDQCAGNPICGLNQQCPLAVICAGDRCESAGGPAVAVAVALSFEVPHLPSYLQVYLLAPQLVGAGSLDCQGLISGIDAGTLNPYLKTEVNPLVETYAQNAQGVAMGAPLDFTLQDSASGTGRVLYLAGYLTAALSDGGDELVGTACDSFNDTQDGGSVGLTLGPP